MSNITIPPAALEAGARAFIEYGVDAAVWDHLGDAYKNQLQKEMSAAIAAALNAWPEMRISWLALNDGAIVLPLPEKTDDKA